MWFVKSARVLPVVALVCAWPAIAAGQTIAYVTAGDQILAVTANGSASVVHTSSCGLLSGDLALGADGKLYFVEPGCLRIASVDPAGNVRRGVNQTYQTVFTSPGGSGDPGAGTELRLAADLGIVFNSTNGVWRLEPETFAASHVAGSGGLGLAIAHNGDAIYLNGSQVEQDATPSPFTPFSAAGAVGLGVTNGGQGSVVSPPLATGAICYSAGNSISCTGGKTSSTPTSYVSFGAAEQVRYFEFISDETALVATSVNPFAGTIQPNGRLYLVNGTGAHQVYATSKTQGRYQPINGVAIPPSSQTIAETSAVSGERTFDFGPIEVRIETQGAAALSVTARQASVEEAQGLLDEIDTSGTNNVYLTAPFKGEESWRTLIDVQVLSGTPGSPVEVYLAGDFGDPFTQNLAMTHFKLQGNQVVLAEVITDGVYPFGPVDPVRGKGDTFSIFQGAVVENAVFTATFCGFERPLDDRARVPPIQGAVPFATDIKLGSVQAVKFRLSTDGCNTEFISDVPNYPFTGAIVSVMRVGDGRDYEIHPPGAANEPPLSRLDTDGGHIFNLDTNPTPEAPWTPGLHIVTVSSLDGLFLHASILVNIVP
jgi:hypothetical protein